MARIFLPCIFESASVYRCIRGEDCRSFRRDIPALPFCHIHLLAKIPQEIQYTDPPKTIGDHIRKRRLQLGWGATQLARVAQSLKRYGIQLGKEPKEPHGAPDTPDNAVPRLHPSALHRTDDRAEDRHVQASPGNEPTGIGPLYKSRSGDFGAVGKR